MIAASNVTTARIHRRADLTRLLLISNGNGEDRIAARLASGWRQTGATLAPQALALTGAGLFYSQAGIDLLAPRFDAPSQGFASWRPQRWLRDFQAGLGRHLLRSFQQLRALRGQVDVVLAVGDLVCVVAATLVGAPVIFFGSALSDYYLDGVGRRFRSSWDPVQIHLLKRAEALVFARDRLTADNLVKRGLPAQWLGNPMLDCLDTPREPCPYVPSGKPVLLLLPGSHADAIANLALMLRQMSACLDLPADWPVLCAPHVSRASLAAVLQSAGWQQQSDHWQCRAARLWLLSDAHFARALALADLAVGLAGTANEQCVGHGVPVISFAGTGTQYTRAFGEAQRRLLGAGLSFLERPHPRLLAEQIDRVLHQPVYREAARQVSNERFGLPGADRRMLQEIQRWLHARNISSAG